ncbi:hypothetical protein KJ780_03000, partial [Candidatus Micrarchaeota archaeon]|nr:hypothetical protein [Candidatus Micrarchaeota archaeon]
SKLPEDIAPRAIQAFMESGQENFLEWAKSSGDKEIQRFASILEKIAANSDKLNQLIPLLETIEKRLKIDTALSIGMVVGSVIPTGSLVTKGVTKAVEAAAARVVVKEGTKKALTFAGGFLVDNIIGDTTGILLSGADAGATLKAALPGYILGLGLIGGGKTLASQLTRENLRSISDYMQEAAKKALSLGSRAVDIIPSKNLVEYARSFVQLKSVSQIQDFLIRSFDETTKFIGTAAKRAGQTASMNYAVFVIDKSKTWLLNSLTPDIPKYIGDAGLEIYFSAVKRMEDKYKSAGLFARTTKQGDELLFVLSGDQAKTLGKTIMQEFAQIVEDEAIKRGFRKDVHPGIFEALTGFSSHRADFTVRAEKNGAVAIFDPKGRKTQLDDLVTEAEVAPLLVTISKAAQDQLRPLIDLKLGRLPARIPDNVPADVHLLFRMNFDSPTSSALMSIAEGAEKAVSQAGMNLAGPSIINLLGHRVTDALTSVYFSALEKALKGKGVDIYLTGPMSFGFKLRKGAQGNLSEIVSKAAAEAEKSFVREAKGLGIIGAVSATAQKRFEAEQKFVSEALGFAAKTEKIEMMNLGIALLHVDGLSLSAVNKGSFFGSTISSLEGVKLPGWVRNAVDFAYFLRTQGLSESQLKKVLANTESLGMRNESRVSALFSESIDIAKKRGQTEVVK